MFTMVMKFLSALYRGRLCALSLSSSSILYSPRSGGREARFTFNYITRSLEGQLRRLEKERDSERARGGEDCEE